MPLLLSAKRYLILNALYLEKVYYLINIYIGDLQIPYVFLMLMFFGILPALLIGIAALLFTIRAIIKKTIEGFKTYFIATVMILLFMVHSTVSTYVFSVFRYTNYIHVYIPNIVAER